MISAGGCSAPVNPWVFNAPPTTVALGEVTENRPDQRLVIVVGRFADPSRGPVFSSGAGQSLSDAFARALMHENRFDVWINPHLTREVELVLNRHASVHEEELAELSRLNPAVDYVVVGKVTDFHHTADLHGALSRWGIIGRRSEAVAAIDLRIVDLPNRRVLGADHVKGVARAGRHDSDDLYRDVALDSYLFWSTPLGRASKRAVERAVRRTHEVTPVFVADAHIEKMLGRRRVQIAGGTASGLRPGQEYYLLGSAAATPRSHEAAEEPYPEPETPDPESETRRRSANEPGTLAPTNAEPGTRQRQRPGSGLSTQRSAHRWTPIRDPALDRFVMVRIETASRSSAEGLLLGAAPSDIHLRGARLSARLPVDPDMAAH